jgi:cyclic lactone autoinducer peptide
MKRRTYIYVKIKKIDEPTQSGALSSVAALALTVTATNMNCCCWFIFGQDKLPDNAKKLRKF